MGRPRRAPVGTVSATPAGVVEVDSGTPVAKVPEETGVSEAPADPAPAALPEEAPEVPAVPTLIRLRSGHGFIDPVHNRGRYEWAAGEIISNPHTIQLMIDRSADFEVISKD